MLNNIEAERVRKRLSQEDLSKHMKISLKTYHNWIKEETDIPSSALIKFSKFFGTDIDYLLEGSKSHIIQNE